jgi:hypothetical protein
MQLLEQPQRQANVSRVMCALLEELIVNIRVQLAHLAVTELENKTSVSVSNAHPVTIVLRLLLRQLRFLQVTTVLCLDLMHWLLLTNVLPSFIVLTRL